MTRLVAAFRNKFINENGIYIRQYRDKIFNHSRKNAPKKRKKKRQIQFSDFLSFLFSTDTPLRTDQHFAHYDQLCSPCAIKYDFIGKQETFENDTDFLLSSVFKGQLALPKSSHATHTNKEITQKMFQNVSKKYKDILRKAYADDFKMFEYSIDGYV